MSLRRSRRSAVIAGRPTAVVVAALLVTGTLALSACGGETTTGADPADTTTTLAATDDSAGDTGDGGSGADAAAATEPAVVVVDAWAREPAMGQTVAAAYVTLSNPGDEEVRLRGARSAIGRTELHETEMGDDGVMSMEERLEGFLIPPGGELVMEPGGVHIMFVDIDREAFLAAGEVVVEFDLADDGVFEVAIPIRVDESVADDAAGDGGDDPHAEMHEEMHGSDASADIALDPATGLPDANVLHDLDDELNAGVYEPERQLAIVTDWRRALLAAEIPAEFDLEVLLIALARLETALYRGDVEAAAALAFEAHDLAHGLVPHDH